MDDDDGGGDEEDVDYDNGRDCHDIHDYDGSDHHVGDNGNQHCNSISMTRAA